MSDDLVTAPLRLAGLFLCCVSDDLVTAPLRLACIFLCYMPDDLVTAPLRLAGIFLGYTHFVLIDSERKKYFKTISQMVW